MSITRNQTVTVKFPWSELEFLNIETRPAHQPIMKGTHDEVEVQTDDGTVFHWDRNGNVSRKTPFGELTTWWAVPTMDEVVHRPADGTFCQFYADGRVTMAVGNGTWLWGPPGMGKITEGAIQILYCTCPDCVDDHVDDYYHD